MNWPLLLLFSAAFTIWYGLGRLCLSYAHSTKMDCYGEWDNSFAVCLWPLFLSAMIAEWVGDAAYRRMKLRERRETLADAQYKRAMRELEKE